MMEACTKVVGVEEGGGEKWLGSTHVSGSRKSVEFTD